MSAAPVSADDEFKAAFSLLSKVLNLLKKLSSAQGDQQKQIQAAVRVLVVQPLPLWGVTPLTRIPDPVSPFSIRNPA